MEKAIRLIFMVAVLNMLTGCLGGTVAQQIARSIATHMVDKAVAGALDVDENAPARKPKSLELEDTQPDDVWLAMATSGFRTVDANTVAQTEPAVTEEEVQILQANSLVRVKLFNLMVGDEKIRIFEKARALGALNLPDRREWPVWNVATGMIENDKKLITFLIPPEFGKLPSGALAVVELADPGNLNIARYKLN